MKHLLFLFFVISTLTIFTQTEFDKGIEYFSDKRKIQELKDFVNKFQDMKPIKPIENSFKTENNSYSVIIDIFRKGTYKVYSYRMENNKFEAIKFSINYKTPKTIISKRLTTDEAKEFEKYINSFPLDELNDSYRDENVRGEHHLTYHIIIGEKKKDINVYFESQPDLVELYNTLLNFVPVDERFYYYTD